MKKVYLIFRSVGERTSDAAMELAVKNIAPDKVIKLENIKPFSKTVEEMLKLEYDCDVAVFMDADCLIMEDLRPFIEKNTMAYIDCFVFDKFRGRIHSGVHITRADVVNTMKTIKIDPNDKRLALRPESRTRTLALEKMNETKEFRDFLIFHDHSQDYNDIFVKYGLRELRSRSGIEKRILNSRIKDWDLSDPDYIVAVHAIEYARKNFPENSSAEQYSKFITALPEIAEKEIPKLGLKKKDPITAEEINNLLIKNEKRKTIMRSREKVFGIGLSRTGTKSLTLGLNMLGYNVVHYPTDDSTLNSLECGYFDFPLLDNFDGITDITVAPYYAQLDRLYPNSKFILTVRDKEEWLAAMEKHWEEKNPYSPERESDVKYRIRRHLRAAVYGTLRFNADRFSFVYDQHHKNVMDYFKDRQESLLIMNITSGDGFEKICPFLNKETIEEEFPKVIRDAELADVLL